MVFVYCGYHASSENATAAIMDMHTMYTSSQAWACMLMYDVRYAFLSSIVASHVC